MKSLVPGIIVLTSLVPILHAAISISDPSATSWNGVQVDFSEDQQTGTALGDLVGSGTNYGMLTRLETGDPGIHTDGSLSFRLRLAQSAGATFDRVAWVGMDADGNGSIDAFIGLNFQGAAHSVGIYTPGTGTNVSPSTTTIGAASYTYDAVAGTNYNYRLVTLSGLTPDGGTTDDVDGGGAPDAYVSFMVPFANLVSFLGSRPIPINITDESPIRYISATATQTNSLNQDLNGVAGGRGSDVTWETLGGFTATVTAGGTAIPETSSALLALGSLSGLFLRRRRC